MSNTVTIAIDGPSAAGKSTLARAIAKALGFLYVDTGALYRAVGCYCLSRGADTADAKQVAALLPEITLELRHDGGEQQVLLNGEDVGKRIREPEMSMAASNVSATPEVRALLLDTQRELAGRYDVVMDGRDIGTVVAPNAKIKFFLTAAPEARARRRYLEYRQKGQQVEYDELLKETIRRDENDMSRALAPLRPAPGALLVDSTDLSLDETLERMLDMIKERL